MPQPHVIFHNICLGCPHSIIHFSQCQYRNNNFYYFHKNIVILFSVKRQKAGSEAILLCPQPIKIQGNNRFAFGISLPFGKKTPVDQIPSVSGSKRLEQACHLPPSLLLNHFSFWLPPRLLA